MKRRKALLCLALIALSFVLVGSLNAFAAQGQGTGEAGFSSVSVSGRRAGNELVKTSDSEVSFELLGIEESVAYNTSAVVADGVMQVSVTSDTQSMHVQYGPDYKNIVRVYLPDISYEAFEIDVYEASVVMEDFNAPVQATGESAGVSLVDDVISRGTYQLEVSNGSVEIDAESVLTDIEATVEYGSLTLGLREKPANLLVDSRNCGPVVNRPASWPALYSVGSGTPSISLSNTMGVTTITVGNE